VIDLFKLKLYFKIPWQF